MANELVVRYSDILDERLYQDLVTVEAGIVPIVNTKYEGSPTAGSVKIPVRDGLATRDYDRANGISLVDASTGYITVDSFEDKAVNEGIDNYEAAAVSDDMIADILGEAGRAGAEAIDDDCIATMEAEGTPFEQWQPVTKENVYDVFVDLRTAASEAKVPRMGRYALCSPTVIAAAIKSDEFTKASALGDAVVQTGTVGRIAGFYLFETISMNATTEIITGHANWLTRIREWVAEPYVADLSNTEKFIKKSAVKARWVFKHKVTRPVVFNIKASEGVAEAYGTYSVAAGGSAGSIVVTFQEAASSDSFMSTPLTAEPAVVYINQKRDDIEPDAGILWSGYNSGSTLGGYAVGNWIILSTNLSADTDRRTTYVIIHELQAGEVGT